MPCADQVPVKSPHSTMLWHKWVVLIAGPTGATVATRAVASTGPTPGHSSSRMLILLADADAVYVTAVNAASDTSNLMTGTVGHSGPIPWSISASIVK